MLLICDWLTFRFDFQTGIIKKKARFVKRTREELLTFPGVFKVRPCPIPIIRLRVSSFTRARLIRSYSLF